MLIYEEKRVHNGEGETEAGFQGSSAMSLGEFTLELVFKLGDILKNTDAWTHNSGHLNWI